MEKPELIHYNGARHLQLYGLDPPLNPHQLGQPVDELVGTPVDILSYGLGMGQTFLYDTKVGTRFGEHATEHNSSVVWWRAAESLQRAPDSAFLYLRTRSLACRWGGSPPPRSGRCSRGWCGAACDRWRFTPVVARWRRKAYYPPPALALERLSCRAPTTATRT